MKVHKVNKKLGETPLEALERFRKVARIPQTAKLTYAGRLDPMASGVLLILEGATQEQKEKYLALPKVYEAEVLFGFKTDTFDLLGIPVPGTILSASEGSFSKLKGKITLPIPAYSSVPLDGKPMFVHARAGKFKTSEPPKREMFIKDIKILGKKKLGSVTLLRNIKTRIKKVKGDFRQKEILKAWNKALRYVHVSKYKIIKIKISCGSGTYIRSIANHLGGTLYSLKRLSVGRYK